MSRVGPVVDLMIWRNSQGKDEGNYDFLKCHFQNFIITLAFCSGSPKFFNGSYRTFPIPAPKNFSVH